MKKVIFIFIFLASLIALSLLLSGCGGQEGSGGQYNFKQGVKEVQFKMLKNAPPSKLYQNTNFKVIVEIDNQAAYDVTGGKVVLQGLDNKYFQIYPLNQPFDLIVGRSLTAPAGEKKYLEFDGTAGELFQNAYQYVGDYELKAEYHSTVDFTDTVCLNPSPYEVYDAGCKVEDRKSFSGQGAPLAVSEMEQIISPGAGAEVEFRVTVRNKGRGKVNEVRLLDARLGGNELPCGFHALETDKKEIILKRSQQQALLICRTFLRDYKSYSTPLLLSFSYDYELKQPHRLNLMGMRLR